MENTRTILKKIDNLSDMDYSCAALNTGQEWYVVEKDCFLDLDQSAEHLRDKMKYIHFTKIWNSLALDCSVEDLTKNDARYHQDDLFNERQNVEESVYAQKLLSLYYKLPANGKQLVNQFLDACS